MSRVLLLFCLLLTLSVLHPAPAQAGFFDWAKKTYNHIKHDIEKTADEVADDIKKGIHDLSKLSKRAYAYVMSKLEGIFDKIVREIEGADGYTPKNDKHHANKSKHGRINIIANNSANITAIGGVSVGIKVGWKGFSHTFHVTLGKANNRINYNSVVYPATDVSGWDIYIDSSTSGNHHYVGIDVNVASVVLK